MTNEEYYDKVNRYQKKIWFHRQAIANIEKKIDRLETDRQQALLKVGNYIKHFQGKSTSFSCLKVEKFDTSKRGFRLSGHGFAYCDRRLSYINSLYFGWDEINNIIDITEEQYKEALNKVLSEFLEVAQ